MYLIYLVVGYSTDFAKMASLCVQSIRDNSPMELIDICIMCDTGFLKYVEHLNTLIHITDINTSGQMCSMRKVEVFNINNIMKYDAILFLDCDIVVCKSVIPILVECSVDKLHVFEEDFKNPHTSKYFYHFNYSKVELQFFKTNNINGFNCGQFLFKPTLEMKKHFDEILLRMKNHTGDYYYEQSFMNVYFNINNHLTERSLFAKYVEIYPDYKICSKKYTIVHFNGGIDKLLRMEHYYELYRKNFKN